MSIVSFPLPLPPNNFSTQIASTSVSSSALSIQLDSVAGLPLEGVGQLFKKDANGDIVVGSIEFIHWTGISGSSITLTDVGDRGITGSDSGAQSYVADDYFEVWVSSYYAPDPDRFVGTDTVQDLQNKTLDDTNTIDGASIINLDDPLNDQDAATKSYVDSEISGLSQAPVTLVDGATVDLDASQGSVFRLTAGGNRTIQPPTNPTDGQKIIIEHLASGGARTLSLSTGTGGFRFGTDITSITATTSGKIDRIGCIYNESANKWDVVAFIKGF